MSWMSVQVPNQRTMRPCSSRTSRSPSSSCPIRSRRKLRFSKASKRASSRSYAVKDMVGRGRYGGVEVGFMHRVADHTVRQIELL